MDPDQIKLETMSKMFVEQQARIIDECDNIGELKTFVSLTQNYISSKKLLVIDYLPNT